MTTLTSVFANLDSAERACRQLEAYGIAQSQLSLTFDEDCPACALERERVSDGPCESQPMGQGMGALLGIGFGIAAVFWPLGGAAAGEGGLANPAPLSLFDWMLRLFIIGSWGLSGAILGGMLAGMLAEAWDVLGRRHDDMPLHSHYILSVDSPRALDSEVLRLIERRGGRLVETPATLRLP